MLHTNRACFLEPHDFFYPNYGLLKVFNHKTQCNSSISIFSVKSVPQIPQRICFILDDLGQEIPEIIVFRVDLIFFFFFCSLQKPCLKTGLQRVIIVYYVRKRRALSKSMKPSHQTDIIFFVRLVFTNVFVMRKFGHSGHELKRTLWQKIKNPNQTEQQR